MNIFAFISLILIKFCLSFEIDPNGYVAYCPCMGRFGNQADHFLGSLSFARSLNRTLILPPWIQYKVGQPRSVQVPFDEYFQVEPLKNYHRVILMSEFMKQIAPQIWPKENRISFCYTARKALNVPNDVNIKDCHAKDGNPFGSFWDTYEIDFTDSEFYGPLHFDVHHSSVAEKWKMIYPASKWPVLAFTGAPASFPVQLENRNIQEHMLWATKYKKKMNKYIQEKIPRGGFIGIHLRNGIDWIRACEHVRDSQQLFASPQCLGYNNERGNLYDELCMQSKELIIRQLKRLIKNVKQSNPSNPIVYVFVASDSNHMIEELNNSLQRMNITAHKLSTEDPYLDLAILGSSNHFIGNCISSYSAFVKRERDAKGLPSYFWAYPNIKDRHHVKVQHEEL